MSRNSLQIKSRTVFFWIDYWREKSMLCWICYTKAELLLEGIFFALNFLPWEFLLVKKLEIEKTKTTNYTTFKTDLVKVVLVFSIFY